MKMDNAGGGLRGLRATPSPELFEALHDYYEIDGYEVDGEQDVIDLGGSSNLNLLIGNGACQYVLRVYRQYVTEARLESIHRVRGKLAADGIPCPQVVATRNGQPWITFDGRLIEVENYVTHDAYMDSWARLKTGLPLLGRIHTILRDVEADTAARKPLFANHIEPHDVLSGTRRGIQRIRAWNPSPAERQLADAAELLAHLVSHAERELVAALPRQLVHGDFWHNNVLFRNDCVILVADFDFMGERARIDDLALTLYFTSLKYITAQATDEQILMLRGLVDAYESSLDEPLTYAERAALVLSMARQPLWSIGGWIALLDAEERARRHAAGMGREIEWALHLMREVDRWQDMFA